MGASAVRARAMDCAVVKAYYYGRERARRQRAQPAQLTRRRFEEYVGGSPGRAAPEDSPKPNQQMRSVALQRAILLSLPFVICCTTRLTRKNAASQNDGLHGEPPSDHRRPPGADRRHERAAHRGKRSLLLPLSPARGAGAARRRGRLPPPPRRPRPLHTAAGAAIHALSRAPRPPRPRARPRN